MQLRYLLLSIVLGVLALFVAVNWSAIMAPTSLSLIFTSIQAPLGLLLLAITALLVVLFLAFVVYVQGAVMVERRRLARELADQRALADQAEASRLTELRGFMQTEFARLTTQNEALRAGIETRLAQVEQGLRTVIEESNNGLSAYIGVLDERLEGKNSD